MGCDIHCFKEKLLDGVWEHQQPSNGKEWAPEEIDIDRNYTLFGLLAKVRGAFAESFEAKGMPDDVSEGTQHEKETWDCDGHSASWLTLEELKTKQVLLLVSPETNNAVLGDNLADFVKQVFTEDDEPANTRVVFWFDN